MELEYATILAFLHSCILASGLKAVDDTKSIGNDIFRKFETAPAFGLNSVEIDVANEKLVYEVDIGECWQQTQYKFEIYLLNTGSEVCEVSKVIADRKSVV